MGNLNMTFNEAIIMAEDIIERFEKIEGKEWKAEGTMMEMQKQVGELAKYIMTAENYYPPKEFEKDHEYAYETLKENIADELADIFYALIRIARYYKIDLEQAHLRARKAEDKFLKSKQV